MAVQQDQEVPAWDSNVCLTWICCCVIIPAAIAGLTTFLVLDGKHAVYSVTVAGLDDLSSVANPSSLSPVFNLTVRIDNAANPFESACIGRLSTVSVSYGDAVLGRGSVPQFCSKGGKVREGGARAWGKDVDLPQFLRDQLAGELAAGEAAVDVKVITPAEHIEDTDRVLVCRQVKIGGVPAPCRTESVVYHGQQAAPGSTS